MLGIDHSRNLLPTWRKLGKARRSRTGDYARFDEDGKRCACPTTAAETTGVIAVVGRTLRLPNCAVGSVECEKRNSAERVRAGLAENRPEALQGWPDQVKKLGGALPQMRIVYKSKRLRGNSCGAKETCSAEGVSSSLSLSSASSESSDSSSSLF